MTTLTASVWDAPFPRKDCWPCAASRDDLAAGTPSIRLCDGLAKGRKRPALAFLVIRVFAHCSRRVRLCRSGHRSRQRFSPASQGRADVRMEYQYWRIAVWSYGMESM